MNAMVLVIVVCLCAGIFVTIAQAQSLPAPDLQNTNDPTPYCSELVGSSLAFAFASGVSAAVPALSAGFLAASVAFAIAAIAIC